MCKTVNHPIVEEHTWWYGGKMFQIRGGDTFDVDVRKLDRTLIKRLGGFTDKESAKDAAIKYIKSISGPETKLFWDSLWR